MIAPSGETCALVMQVVSTEPHGRNVGLDSFKDIGESEEEVGSRQGGGTGSCVPLSRCGSTIQHRSVISRCACYSRKAGLSGSSRVLMPVWACAYERTSQSISPCGRARRSLNECTYGIVGARDSCWKGLPRMVAVPTLAFLVNRFPMWHSAMLPGSFSVSFVDGVGKDEVRSHWVTGSCNLTGLSQRQADF